MANDSTLVVVGKPAVTGGAYVGDTTATLPTDSTTTIDTSLSGVGFISEDGVTQSINEETSDVKAWGGDVVRRIQSSHDVTYQLTMIETNGVSLAAYYGTDNVTAGEARLVAGDLPRQAWVFEIVDDTRTIRIVVAQGQITERGEITYIDSDAVSYPVTITAYPDPDAEDGAKAVIYYDGLDES